MSELFEFFMVFLFGLSWPITIRKSWTARTAKGKSILFSMLVWVGYLCGVIGKLVSGRVTYVFLFYVINLCSVTVDICLSLRNLRLDRMAGDGEEEPAVAVRGEQAA